MPGPHESGLQSYLHNESPVDPFCDRERRAIHVPPSALTPFEECAAGSSEVSVVSVPVCRAASSGPAWNRESTMAVMTFKRPRLCARRRSATSGCG